MGCTHSSTAATSTHSNRNPMDRMMDGMMSNMMEQVTQMQQAQIAKQQQLVRDDPECAQLLQKQNQAQQKYLLAMQSGDAAGQLAAQQELLELQKHPKWMNMMMPDIHMKDLMNMNRNKGMGMTGNGKGPNVKTYTKTFTHSTSTMPTFGMNNNINNMNNMDNMFNMGATTTATTEIGTGAENGLPDSSSMFANLMHGTGAGISAGGGIGGGTSIGGGGGGGDFVTSSSTVRNDF